MDNLWEIFPSIDEYYNYLDDHPQLLLHQIPTKQPDGLSYQQNIMGNRHEDPTWNPNNLNNNDSGVESFKAAATCTKEKKRKIREIKQSGEGDDDDRCKRALHRDVEKRRRNQMASLYTSLRSLLPLEYIKGKRSASDHMQASVSYIKDLKKKIEGLHNQKENIIMTMKMMKKTTSSNMAKVVEKSNVENVEAWGWANDDVSVAVNKCSEDNGVEILMMMNTRRRGGGGGLAFSLSKLLETLLRQGLNVVNCCYSHQEDWSLLRIQSQVNGWSDADVAALQQKLVDDVVIKPH